MPIILPPKPPANPGISRKLRVLVACEYSGRVRDAFMARGHYAMSCDFLASESEGLHYQGDVRDVIGDAWDMMIAFPSCTYLATSGNRWHAGSKERLQALEFIRELMNASIEYIAIENPVGIISSHIRKPDQIIQPWEHGHGEVKSTCLWLKNLPKLVPSNVVTGRIARVHRESPGPERWLNRTRTLTGIARAMSEQWG